jgi:hypothetical protein
VQLVSNLGGVVISGRGRWRRTGGGDGGGGGEGFHGMVGGEGETGGGDGGGGGGEGGGSGGGGDGGDGIGGGAYSEPLMTRDVNVTPLVATPGIAVLGCQQTVCHLLARGVFLLDSALIGGA